MSSSIHTEQRIADAVVSSPQESKLEHSIRPQQLQDYIGQKDVSAQMQIFMQAARQREEALDHTLIFGPPGLGKTTLAHIIASEMQVNLKQTSGPILEKAGDLAAILTNLDSGDVLFIDEIHRLSPAIEEILYPAMEDAKLDIVVGEGPAARSIQLDLPAFTLVGATTRAGLLTSPLRDRFGIVQRLEFYHADELAQIIQRSAGIMQVSISCDASLEIARRARGTPRIANRLLRRVRDYAQVISQQTTATPPTLSTKATPASTIPHEPANTTNHLQQPELNHCHIDHKSAQQALDLLHVDRYGFDNLDRKFLHALLVNYHGGPAGVESLAAAISEDRGTVEDILEPYLLQEGFLQRTPRGRVATAKAFQHLGLEIPNNLQQLQQSIPLT